MQFRALVGRVLRSDTSNRFPTPWLGSVLGRYSHGELIYGASDEYKGTVGDARGVLIKGCISTP